jgi:RHS repeat-associated protein
MEDSAAGTFTVTYDADGKMIEAGLPNGLAAQASFDEVGSPTHLAYEKTLCSEVCTWLEFSRQSSIHGQVLAQQSTLSSQEYSYDEAGRLVLAKDTEEGKCTTRTYSFDANTNRTKLITREPGEGGACDIESEGDVQNYTYDTADRLIGEGVEYDNLGRTTSLPAKYSGGGKLETTYYVNDLTRSQTQDGITNTYELDAGLRQRKRTRVKGEEESTEIYHYANGSDSPAWIDEGEGQWSRFIGGIGAGAIEKSGGEVILQLADMHGDVVATADVDPEATELLSTQQFDEYGNPKQKLGLDLKLGWLGSKMRRTELPSGVIQMGVRSYVPAMGRFLSPDPVKGGSANAYEYAAGDPVNNFDLTGEKCATKNKQARNRCIQRKNRNARRRARRRGSARGVRQAVVRKRPCTAIACTSGWGGGSQRDSVIKFLTKVTRATIDYLVNGSPAERNVQQHIRSMYADAGAFLRRHAAACAAGAAWGWGISAPLRAEDPLFGSLQSGAIAGGECVEKSLQ